MHNESTSWLSDVHRACAELLGCAALDANLDARDAIRRLVRDGVVRDAYHTRVVADLDRLPPSRDDRVHRLAMLATSYEDRRALAALIDRSPLTVDEIEHEARVAHARYRLLSVACRIAVEAREGDADRVLSLVRGVALVLAPTEARRAA